jgi:heterodisulfide reductase subunit A
MRKEYGALVVGAGIGGIRAAMDLAVAGQKVALIDARPTHGGILAQLDHQFPTDKCGMCKMLPMMDRDSSSQYCLRKGLFHENIDLLLSTELASLEGDPGRFHVVLNRKSSLVDPNKCISCGECARVCPVRVPNEFNAGLTERAAAFLPVPYAIPNHYVIDLEHCQRCWQCFEACPSGAIDFKFDQRKDFHILVADPDPDTGEFLNDWLKAHNFPIISVTSGAEAVDKLAESGDYRLLIVDFSLSDMDLERVLLRAQELRPGLPVIVMAQEEDQEEARGLLAKGAREVLAKPLDPKTLVPWLDKLYMRISSDETLEMTVGAVILATGFDCYDPGPDAEVLGYGLHPGVVTALEFERLLSGTGPTGGRLLRPRDNAKVGRIAWIQCVGSRDHKKNADYCSSICCMFSIKEALLAREKMGAGVETAIFYMDMRTFGREYQHYREAAGRDGVRFVRARPHSVVPAPDGSLSLEYFGEDGTMHDEHFDMVVLATGARPPAGLAELAARAGVELNKWGFLATDGFNQVRTSRLGVYAAGAAAEPRDIAESVMTSGAAAQEAARQVKIHEFLTGGENEPEPEYVDVSRQPPRVFVAVCASCPSLEKNLDFGPLFERLSKLPGVVHVAPVHGACTRTGWEEIQTLCADHSPNRVLIGACLPYVYIPRLRELGRTIELDPGLMDVVDIYSPTFTNNGDNNGDTAKEVYATISMALTRLLSADPLPPPQKVEVAKAALVVGGGLAGMTCALAVADQGYDAVLVEETESLGGEAMKLHYTLDSGEPRRFMEDLIESVNKHPHIRVLTESRVVFCRGDVGRFQSMILTPRGPLSLDHGAVVLATGGKEAKIYDYGNRVHKTVLTQRELEERLATGALDTADLSGVAMIQCWRSREGEREYCSRICCAQALKNILYIKTKNPDVPIYVFYRDFMSYGFTEEYYTKARRAGAQFIRYDLEDRPKVEFDQEHRPVITVTDQVLGRTVRITADILALSSGVEPGEVDDVKEIFGVETTPEGFFQEAESKWRPVDFLKEGVFMAGLARAPGNMPETVASAKAAAQRAVRILSLEKLPRETVVAQVRHTLCSLCQACVAACPYGARRLDMDEEKIVVDEILCQGCGSCAAVCPNSATLLRGYSDRQVLSTIDAALEVI